MLICSASVYSRPNVMLALFDLIIHVCIGGVWGGGALVTAKAVFACITLLCGVPFKRLIPSLITCTIW